MLQGLAAQLPIADREQGALSPASRSRHLVGYGEPPPGGDGLAEDYPGAGEQARLRALRDSGFAALFLANDPYLRFWFRDLRRVALFLALMRESAYLRDGKLGCHALSTLAQRSQMCLARVSQILELACGTGDFRRLADPRDARQHIFEPSARAEAALETLVARYFAAAASCLGCEDPLPSLGAAARRKLAALFVDAALSGLGALKLDDRGSGSLTFMLVVLDLYLHSPIGATDFVRREAMRVRVTSMTLRNVLWRAENAGMARRSGRTLWSTPRAARAIGAVLEGFEARARMLMQAAAALQAEAGGAVRDGALAAMPGRSAPARLPLTTTTKGCIARPVATPLF